MKKKRIIVRLGDIFKITLEDGEHCYCIKLAELMAFFDYKSTIPISKEEILNKKIIFIVGVDSDAVKIGGWEKVGNDKEFAKSIEVPNYFIWDSNAKKFEIYLTKTGEIKSSTYKEIKNLERVAAWANNHIEDRLRDHFSGQKCIWLEEDENIKRMNTGVR